MTPVHEHWLVQHLLKINGGLPPKRQWLTWSLHRFCGLPRIAMTLLRFRLF
jgi:hypothetical protein